MEPDPDDVELVARAGERDLDARNRLAQKYWAVLVRYLRRLLGPEDAEDVAADSLMHALETIALGRFDPGKGNFKSWLFRIAHNRAIDLLRRRRAQVPIEDWMVWYRPDNGDLNEAFWDCVKAIPHAKWEMLMLRDVDGQPLGEVASEHGWTKNTASARLSDVRGALADCLERKGYPV